ncbi:hypothetical protein HMN09_00269800 [Mycena chlorophos]|uniref:Uncharacterized protein n=1 Tax=Mycena chlorophos TaxID=658473 RepID=A0A8H6WIZ0_MYCCL|nr:hypothetical protein HMN09_00269800 [Mycena chlorophos]
MARWTDDDSEALPPGMRRIGYDGDSGRYEFQDEEGNIYQGSAGTQVGFLTLVRRARRASEDPDEEDPEGWETQSSIFFCSLEHGLEAAGSSELDDAAPEMLPTYDEARDQPILQPQNDSPAFVLQPHPLKKTNRRFRRVTQVFHALIRSRSRARPKPTTAEAAPEPAAEEAEAPVYEATPPHANSGTQPEGEGA